MAGLVRTGMTELEIPRDADDERVAQLIADHVTVGDVVEVWERDRTDADDPEHTGEVTGIEPGYLELDGRPLEGGSVRYDEIGLITRRQSAEN